MDNKPETKKNKVLIKVLLLVIVLSIVILSLFMCNYKTKKDVETKKTAKQTTTEEQTTLPTYEIGKPKALSKKEIKATIKEYSKNDYRFKELYDHMDKYSKSELNKAINNPEMADFIIGCKYKDKKVYGGITEEEKNEKYPLFNQWDERWGYVKYGDSNIGYAGCGPTCLSMVAYALTRNPKITPDKVAKYAEKHGHYVNNIGTSWTLFGAGAKHYGLRVSGLAVSKSEMKQTLKNGGLLILAVGKGDFTLGGHFVVVYGYENNGFKVNDPFSIARSKTYNFNRLAKQTKTMWAYYKKK